MRVKQVIRRIRWLFIIPVLSIVSGCVSTHHEEEKTGLFGNDPIKTMTAFELVEQGKTTQKELEQIGFDSNAPNVNRLMGPEGMKELLGEQCFDTALRDGNNILPLFQELSHYSVFIFPLRDIIETEDRFYFSTKNTDTVGRDDKFVFILKDGVVIYKAPKLANIDKHESEHAFAQGLLNVLEQFSGGISKLYDLIKKLKP